MRQTHTHTDSTEYIINRRSTVGSSQQFKWGLQVGHEYKYESLNLIIKRIPDKILPDQLPRENARGQITARIKCDAQRRWRKGVMKTQSNWHILGPNYRQKPMNTDENR